MDNENLMEKENLSDHDLLIRTCTIVERVDKGFNNHLTHHARRDIAMLVVTIGAVFTAMISVGCAIIAVISNLGS